MTRLLKLQQHPMYKKPNKSEANNNYLKSTFGDSANPYKEETITRKKLFLILCEGENTEKFYFEGFPVPTNAVKVIGGQNTKNKLVDVALEHKQSEEYQDHEIWCVFDYDIHRADAKQAGDFNSAIIRAEANNLKVAWSNDAFELWFVLHYQPLVTPLRRTELYPILEQKWNLNSFDREAKKRDFCKDHYKRHSSGENGASQERAIKNARKLHAAYGTGTNYDKQVPCTTVYLLVQELNKYL